MAQAISPAAIPKNCSLYYLIIDKGIGDRGDGWAPGLKYKIKSWILKWYLSIAEVIAHW